MTSVSRRILLATGFAASASLKPALARPAVAPPRPWGATPSPRQLAWHAREQYAFIHFSINTFTGREWGYGDESPALFNPTEFSPDQIVSAAKAGGMRGIILTAKHHDGFCLWPTRLTERCIRNSPYRGGHGDVVGEMAAATRAAGLAFGLYLSPWDRHHPEYGRPAYLDYFRAQIRELCTGYGELFEFWLCVAPYRRHQVDEFLGAEAAAVAIGDRSAGRHEPNARGIGRGCCGLGRLPLRGRGGRCGGLGGGPIRESERQNKSRGGRDQCAHGATIPERLPSR
jgi:hypothetical protein